MNMQLVPPRGSGAVARLSRRAHIQSLPLWPWALLDSRATAPLARWYWLLPSD